jgi:serine/threonine-protein kinase
MDETPVTNHQYENFLNQTLPRIQVEGGVVRGDGEIWVVLGEILEGYEPMVFRGGRFHLTSPAHASCPVLRVTPRGAEVYAHFYGRRLPTEAEWLLAQRSPEKPSGRLLDSILAGLGGGVAWAQHGPMHGPSSDPPRRFRPGQPPSSVSPEPERGGSPAPREPRPLGEPGPPDRTLSRHAKAPAPVLSFPPNAYGIRGLGADVGEWGIRVGGGSPPESREPGFAVMPSAVLRQPWEAFEDVGFRTAADVEG